jgi:broad specificity phosphatase PhoE
MKRLMIVRHGESEWNALRRLQGQADIALSDRGRDQARALAATIAALAPDAAVTSDLKRARETAALLGYPEAECLTGLREVDVGNWTGQPIADITATDAEAYRGWRAGTFTPPQGEAWADFTARTTRAVAAGLERAERLLVVCHGGVVRALLETLIQLPPKRIIPVAPASLTVLASKGLDQTSMRLELFNYSPNGPVFDAPD